MSNTCQALRANVTSTMMMSMMMAGPAVVSPLA